VTSKHETSNLRLLRGLVVMGWMSLLFVSLSAIAVRAEGRTSSAPSIFASPRHAKFCQIADADRLAEIAQGQSPPMGVQMLTDHREVQQGEVVFARLANFTTRTFLSIAEFKIQRYGLAGWQTDSSSPDGPWPLSAAKLKPDGTKGCYRYFVPYDQPFGRYRFLTKVHTRSHQFPETAEFSIR